MLSYYLKIILEATRPFFNVKYNPFLSSSQFVKFDMNEYNSLDLNNLVSKFEDMFINLIGNQNILSFSSARMGFFHLLKVLDIKKGDEIIICSGTCSVMINSIIRSGAKPIYSDIDSYTLGSSEIEISKKISNKTRMIIAQHNFGIPCQIEEIQRLCNMHEIFLLEDCALTLQSKVNRISVGSFGDAAIYSLDHTKPLNCFTGGVLSIKDNFLFSRAKRLYLDVGNISRIKQSKMIKRFIREDMLFKSKKLNRLKIFDLILTIKRKLGYISPFLDENSDLKTNQISYPYPAKLPPFSAYIGIMQLDNWEKTVLLRKQNFNLLIKELNKSTLKSSIPKVYFDKKFNIIPLRFVIWNENSKILKDKLGQFIDIEGIWFQKPIISSKLSSNFFGYKNDCPVSEKIGHNIINIPLDISQNQLKILIENILIKTNLK